jgi:predicted Zn-dependent protease
MGQRFFASVFLTASLAVVGCAPSVTTPTVDITFQPMRDFVKDESQVAPQEENVIGRGVAAKLLGVYQPSNNAALTAYINQVGSTVAAASLRPETFAGYSFLLIESDELNAMAAPGGYILISRGLLKLLTDEDMLAAVLAHEVSHVVLRHGLQAIKREHLNESTPLDDSVPLAAALTTCAINCNDVSQQLLLAFNGAIDDIVEKLTKAGYSREQELQADVMALGILEKAGYDPSALKRVLDALAQQTSKGGWFSTHPKAKDRSAALGKGSKDKTQFNKGYQARKNRFKQMTTSK